MDTTFLSLGESLLFYDLWDTHGHPIAPDDAPKIKWKSTNRRVATVKQHPSQTAVIVTAKKEGTTRVSMTGDALLPAEFLVMAKDYDSLFRK